jgi:Protein of unknown function (DUF1573)
MRAAQSRARSLTAVALGLGAALAICQCEPGRPTPPPQPPKIVFDAVAYDFGQVVQGASVAHAFTFRNTGGSPLAIDNLKTACDCTAAAISGAALAPGGSDTIRATFDTSQVYGRINRAITVYSNDPSTPFATLTFRGVVKPIVAADPPALYVGRVTRGAQIESRVRIVAADPNQLKIEPADQTVVSARLSDEGETGNVLAVSVKPKAPLGRFSESVTVVSNGATRPSITVPIVGFVEGDVTVTPTYLSFGHIVRGQAAEQSLIVRNRGGAPVRVTRTSLSPAIGRAHVEAVKEGREYRITVTLNDSLLPGRVRGMLHIHTDDPDQSSLSVPFEVRVRHKGRA